MQESQLENVVLTPETSDSRPRCQSETIAAMMNAEKESRSECCLLMIERDTIPAPDYL